MFIRISNNKTQATITKSFKSWHLKFQLSFQKIKIKINIPPSPDLLFTQDGLRQETLIYFSDKQNWTFPAVIRRSDDKHWQKRITLWHTAASQHRLFAVLLEELHKVRLLNTGIKGGMRGWRVKSSKCCQMKKVKEEVSEDGKGLKGRRRVEANELERRSRRAGRGLFHSHC